MLRFFTGDELGCIKSIQCSKDPQSSTGWKLDERILFNPPAHAQINSGKLDPEKAKESGVQKLALLNESDSTMVCSSYKSQTNIVLTPTPQEKLAAAKSNGVLSVFSVNSDDRKLEISKEWRESRYKVNHKFVGLNLSSEGLFWCTSNGALGRSVLELDAEEASSSFRKATLPMRLCSWNLSPDASSFAYGGNEVDLSVWDTERTFQETLGSQVIPSENSDTTKKRKRAGDLFPAEIWRAKNLPNDALSLRQPIHITSLSYLSSSSVGAGGVHLVSGTEGGDVRRYDTRAARRPIANWTSVAKVGGIGLVRAGLSEHELFVADNGTSLSALDLRNGRTIYSYKKLQGAITSVAQSSNNFLGSTSRDRYFRLHSTFPPPAIAGCQQEGRGEIFGTLYMKSVPTTVVCGELMDTPRRAQEMEGQNEIVGEGGDEEDENDDVWATMRDVGEGDDEDEGRIKTKRQLQTRS
ncbi:hypothetical protein A7U60_g8758 [Sanghuangporus baumii]|uniref:Ribosome biogenesis protein NSA1 n=1 Tax=Sanghuangporus baumii TaxID=108892 RepID=A0A9Q5HQE6_SANBA|nr:hypothetical protein A7U60_g8758 [Sanghuangporus baumii]